MLLTNNLGGYFLNDVDSRYSGLFFFINNKMFKIVDEFKTDKKINFYMISKKNSFIFLAQDFVELLLDIKESYDNSEFGRIYEVKENKDNIIIKFVKENGFALYLVITGFSEYKKIDKWIKKDYEFDKKRNSQPFERYVYNAIKIKGEKILLSAAETEEKAVEESNLIINNINSIILNKKDEFRLEQLLVQTDKGLGIFAGLPWFFQFWTRDELISLKGLMLSGKNKEAKEILLRNLNSISNDGRLPNQTLPLAEKTNADSIGWLFKRIQDFNKFDLKEKKLIEKKIEFSIEQITKNYMKDGLIYNAHLETWMDTEWAYDNRNGFRIEIQALFLNMLRSALKLTKNKKYKVMEENMKRLVKEKFFNGVYLVDGLDDWTKRPNVFIAAYIYPQLLTQKEWTICFKNILQDLWLDWGGISTIDKTNPLFCKKHTGEIPQSYHRGDSWFWINNLAAIVLYRTDKKIFKMYIDKIIKSSSNNYAELSSASKLSEEGCLYQAWTNATFIELINEIKK